MTFAEGIGSLFIAVLEILLQFDPITTFMFVIFAITGTAFVVSNLFRKKTI